VLRDRLTVLHACNTEMQTVEYSDSNDKGGEWEYCYKQYAEKSCSESEGVVVNANVTDRCIVSLL
jgi:hypothetical protein